MKSKFLHSNINVTDIDRSLKFYESALGLKELRRREGGSFTLAFLGDGETSHQLELTCLHEHKEPYDLGENESHIAFEVEDFGAAHKLHEEMGCICYEN
ncbi:MAG: VOC family protein, partial [Synergistaceae bacterium]|nr:VOC family protein [Synergistaceae bacterium]